MIRLSLVKKWSTRLNVLRTISNSFKVSLTKSFPVVQEKNDRSFLWQQRILDGQNVKLGRSCPLTGRYFDPWDALFWARLSEIIPSKYLPVQSQQQKHYKKMWNMLKVNNKDTRTMSLTLSLTHFTSFCSVSVTGFGLLWKKWSNWLELTLKTYWRRPYKNFTSKNFTPLPL